MNRSILALQKILIFEPNTYRKDAWEHSW